MAQQLIGAAAASSLPEDWQRQAVRRLGFVSATFIGVAVFGLLLSLLSQPNTGVRANTDRPSWVMVLGLLASIGMFLSARRRSLRPEEHLDVGLIYLVFMCGLAAIFRHSLPYGPDDVLRGVSVLAMGMLYFAVLVPVPPRRMAVAALAAAALDPLALWLSVAGGNPMPRTTLWLWLFAPNLVAVALSVATARAFHTLGQSVKRAREMGSYRLHEQLGAGGMGEVWRAEHRMLARPAAIKLVSPSVLGGFDEASVAVALARFEREAQATAALTSPHTIEVYDFGVAQDGTFYYVMELLHGMDLLTVLSHSPVLGPARTLHLLLQVCHSLRDAHDAGVVHRDIKPANVFVCRMGGEVDFVKVLDFGLVKRFDAADEANPVTIAGELAGTPGYMAPEAIRGLDLGPRSDIYAIGCLAYRMLAGRAVFVEEGFVPTLTAHLEKEPEPLVSAAKQDLPGDLCKLVMQCLAKNADERPPDVGTLMARLSELAAAHPWTAEQARDWWKRHDPPPARPMPSQTETLAAQPLVGGA